MGSSATSLVRCNQVAAAQQTEFINAKARLFKSPFAPTPATLRAAFLANECDFDNYAAKVIAAWSDPVLASGGGWMITGGQLVWIWSTAGPNLGNQVAGIWYETTGGDLIGYTIFDAVVNMTGEGQPCIVDPIQVTPTNQVVTTLA